MCTPSDMGKICFSESTAAAFCTGRLSGQEMIDAEQHIDGCSDCADFVGLLAQVEAGETRTENLSGGFFVDRYLIVGPVGRGVMGQVYKAFDPHLERTVALKLLHREGSSKPSEQLLAEARTMAQLSHPNVVAVHDSGAHEGQLFLTMEYVDGPNLKEWLQSQSRSTAAILRLFTRAGRGLSAAHAAGIIHRDFKPDNVLVRDETSSHGTSALPTALVTDFGLSRPALQPGEDHVAVVVGTPIYMAPEQLRGQPATAQSDQFAFAVAMYWALYRRRPYGGTTLSTLLAHIENDTVDFTGQTVPTPIREALERALSPVPANRFPTMEALLTALNHTPSRGKGVKLMLGLGGLATAIAGSLLWGGDEPAQEEPCTHADRHMAGIWDSKIQTQTQQHFAAFSHPDAEEIWRHTQATLNTYAGDWTLRYESTCRATEVYHDQPELVYAAKMDCLTEAQRALEALVSMLGTLSPEYLLGVAEATRSLPNISECANASQLLAKVPVPDAIATSVEQQRSVMRETTLRYNLGDYHRGRTLLMSLEEQVPPLGYAPLSSRVALLSANDLVGRGKIAGANTKFEEATWLAFTGRDDAYAVYTATTHARNLATKQSDFTQAQHWTRHAQAIVTRLGNTPHLQAHVDGANAIIAHQRGERSSSLELIANALAASSSLTLSSTLRQYQATFLSEAHKWPEAQAAFENNLDIARTEVGENHPEVAQIRSSMAGMFRNMGKLSQAEEQIAQAVQILLRHRPNTRSLSLALLEQANIFVAQNRSLDAESPARQALEIAQRAVPPVREEVALTLTVIANIAGSTGRYADARDIHLEILEIYLELFGEKHPQTAITLSNLGYAYRDLGDFATSRDFHIRSLAIEREVLGDHNPDLAWNLSGIGETLIHLDSPKKALPYLQEALALREKHAGGELDLAETRYLVARALLEARQPPQERVSSLAALALPVLEQHNAGGQNQANTRYPEIEEWLRRQIP